MTGATRKKPGWYEEWPCRVKGTSEKPENTLTCRSQQQDGGAEAGRSVCGTVGGLLIYEFEIADI
jgi:hypothetical protein